MGIKSGISEYFRPNILLMYSDPQSHSLAYTECRFIYRSWKSPSSVFAGSFPEKQVQKSRVVELSYNSRVVYIIIGWWCTPNSAQWVFSYIRYSFTLIGQGRGCWLVEFPANPQESEIVVTVVPAAVPCSTRLGFWQVDFRLHFKFAASLRRLSHRRCTQFHVNIEISSNGVESATIVEIHSDTQSTACAEWELCRRMHEKDVDRWIDIYSDSRMSSWNTGHALTAYYSTTCNITMTLYLHLSRLEWLIVRGAQFWLHKEGIESRVCDCCSVAPLIGRSWSVRPTPCSYKSISLRDRFGINFNYFITNSLRKQPP